MPVSSAAAAISGIFNAPLGGVVFAVEAIIGQLSVSSFIPLVISSVMATATSRLFLGDHPILIAPAVMEIAPQDYFFLALAGIVNYRQLIHFFRYFLVLAFVIGAVLTPPDIITQMLLAAPLIVLYAMSVGFAYAFGERPSD